MKSLTSLFTDGDVERAAAVLRETLEATTTVVLSPVKGKPSESLRVPDHRMRLEAAKVIVAYTEGLPVARQMNLASQFKELDQAQCEILASSKAVREALQELDGDGAPAGGF